MKCGERRRRDRRGLEDLRKRNGEGKKRAGTEQAERRNWEKGGGGVKEERAMRGEGGKSGGGKWRAEGKGKEVDVEEVREEEMEQGRASIMQGSCLHMLVQHL